MLPVDVVVKTSDAKFFGTHLQNLESYAEGFPPESLAKDKTINHMNIDEDSEVASLMLHLMHRQPQPDLQNIPIRVLVELAEAVEKYLIYSSIGTCRFIMSIRASEAPLLVLAYALKHGYQDVADCAAPHSLGTPLKAVKKELGPTGTALWVSCPSTLFIRFFTRSYRRQSIVNPSSYFINIVVLWMFLSMKTNHPNVTS
ncbi:hypothetical protein BDN72DRAFT_522113 [Pluteus cervinus]|uniref:Uncharacterized protein n=1 Tax=Pluteus cervinus TaxID=181527 RepID=A0ACD3AXN3_9AGAR|nr:hypothetical protein BDN72DRAFT_522113 [Pluteus cervinus]